MQERAGRHAAARHTPPQALRSVLQRIVEVCVFGKRSGTTAFSHLQVKDTGKKRATKAERRPDGMRAARHLTGPEWQHHFEQIVEKSYEMLEDDLRATGEEGKDVKLYFAFDNCHSHNLAGIAFPLLAHNCGIEHFLVPPRYSGDFMQVIEHCHAITTREYYKRYMQRGGSGWNAAEQWRNMRAAFFKVIKADFLRKAVLRVPVLAREVSKAHGCYVDAKWT